MPENKTAAQPAGTADHQRKRARSPSYPGIGLQKAIELAGTLRKQEGRNAAPVNAVLHHYGYKPKSGGGLVTIAALKKFGLVTDAGSGDKRTLRISDLANRILVDEREVSPERDQLVKQAALMPSIHREIWSKYAGNLPSDPTLSYFLKTEKGFTDVAVREFIPQFRDTIRYAKLAVSDRISGESESEQGDDEERQDVLNPLDVETGRPIPPKASQGRAVLWQQTQNLSTGLVAELRIVGEAGRAIRVTDLERLKRHLELGIEALEDEEREATSASGSTS